MYVDSFYKKVLSTSEKRICTGYDYGKNGLINKFVSPRLYLIPRVEGFLNLLDKMLIEITETVKKVQFYTNYTIDKNDRSLNL